MGKLFWNDAIGPTLPGEPTSNIERGYALLASELAGHMDEVSSMLARIERRIEEREVNALYAPNDGSLDPVEQSRIDAYYRTEADKLRALLRGMGVVKDRSETPGHDPARTQYKVVSIR